jgi:hypothetical protein
VTTKSLETTTAGVPAIPAPTTERVMVRADGLVISLPDALPEPAAKLANNIARALATIEKAVVDSPEMYQLLIDKGNQLKVDGAEIEALRMDITRPIDAEKKRIMGLFEPASAGATKGMDVAREKCKAWNRKQAEIAEKARQAAQAEADRKRREELAIAAEAQRKADEAAAEARRAQEAEARKVREAQAAAQAAIDAGNRAAAEAAAQALRDAEAAQRAADIAAADAEAEAETSAQVLQATELAPAMAVLPAEVVQPKAAGATKRRTYSFQVMDKRMLIVRAAAEIVARKLPNAAQSLQAIIGADLGDSNLATYLEPNEKAIGAIVRSAGESCNIPGVRISADENIALTGGRR